MDYIRYTLNFLIVLFIFMVIIRIYMEVASYIGKQLGFGKFFMYLCRKIIKKIK